MQEDGSQLICWLQWWFLLLSVSLLEKKQAVNTYNEQDRKELQKYFLLFPFSILENIYLLSQSTLK